MINIEEKILVHNVLRWIFRKWDVGVWTGLSWLRKWFFESAEF
jgi:hypothetical protein